MQKELVEYRTGTIAALLDKEYKYLLEEVAKGLPQGRQGQALAWKNKNVVYQSRDEIPENLFLNNEVIRQDLVGELKKKEEICLEISCLEKSDKEKRR